MDLSWNYATESQAYDRVHRLGQEKEVFVKRLVVRDTIEERYVSVHLLCYTHTAALLTAHRSISSVQDAEVARHEAE